MEYNQSPSVALPPQMLPLSKKNDKWKQAVMDRLEQIGRYQIMNHSKILENYEIVKGKFIYSHYIDTNKYPDIVDAMTQDFEMPSTLRHHDIISQAVNVLSGEYQKRPDNFKVKGYDDGTTNAFLRKKTELLLDYVIQEIQKEIEPKLIAEGWDPNKQDFTSEEEQQQYMQQMDQRKQALTPPEIETYMSQNFQTIAELWGQHRLEMNKNRYNLNEKEKKEFEDMLIADRCFRHFFLKGTDYDQETWNPVTVFFHKSPEIDYIEDGDYVGRVLYLTPSTCIDRYGWMMTETEIKALQSINDIIGNIKGVDGYGVAYGSVVPFKNYPDYKVIEDAMGIHPLNPLSTLDENFLKSVSSGNMPVTTKGYIQVTEAYWRSMKRIGKVCYIDPETGIITKTLVDENFVVPEHFTVVDSNIYDTDEPDTITWTWVNESWGGIKLNPLNVRHKSIYLNVKPLEFQFKGDSNPYGSKLPVCGQIFNNRNGVSASMVDLMKPPQIGYNIAINQLIQLMEREIGRFNMIDIHNLPNSKDWGGEKGFERWIGMARSLGMVPVDTSTANTGGANASGHFPKVIDLDESSRMLSRIELANFFEQQALKLVGITPQRLGEVQASESATGVNQSVSQSYAQTESYFTNFSNYKKRCLRMDLDIAQYVESNKENVTVTYTKSDMSRAFLQLKGSDLLADLGVYVSNSQEDIRQLETLRQLALTNNTSEASIVDLAAIVTMNSPREIKAQLEKSFKQQQQIQSTQSQQEQQKMEMAAQQAQAQRDFEANENQLDRESKERIAYINTFSRQDNNMVDTDSNQVPDMLEYNKFQETVSSNRNKDRLEARKQALNERKQAASEIQSQKQNELKEKEMAAKERIESKKLQIAKTNKNKYDK